MSIGRLERNAGRLLNRPANEEDVDQFMNMNNKQMLRDRYDYSQQQKKTIMKKNILLSPSLLFFCVRLANGSIYACVSGAL
jgi:hypothetical protein